MRDFIVRFQWSKPGKKVHEEIHDFFTLEDAEDYADFKAKQFREYGYDFAIRIYKAQD